MGNSSLKDICISEALKENAIKFPEKHAFVFLKGEQERAVSYSELYETVKSYSKILKSKFPKNSRLLLLFDDTYEFIASFLSVKLSGSVPVPMYPPKSNRKDERLDAILKDSKPVAILTSNSLTTKFSKFFGKETIDIELLDLSDCEVPNETENAHVKSDNLSFLQYTSGSTSRPKGVMISHQNLRANLESMQSSYAIDSDSILCSWLPFYHDMGLVGKLLQTVFTGCTLVTIPSSDFIRKPSVWLKAISDYKVTHSAAPNFAYDLCEKIGSNECDGLDLSSWKVAVNGSETIKASTLDNFAKRFKGIGFNESALTPSYGLAESTLFVSGGRISGTISVIKAEDFDTTNSNKAIQIVSSGRIADGMKVSIRDRDTNAIVDENVEGEILLLGDSIMTGYWNKNEAEGFVTVSGSSSKYLATGDLGFIRDNELFVTGRIKEILIIRGKNYLPYDIEDRVSKAEERIVQNGVAACGVLIGDQEELVVVAEVRRSSFKTEEAGEICHSILKSIRENFALSVHEAILIPTMGLPRTSSGKIQRFVVANKYLNSEFTNSFSSKDHLSTERSNVENPERLSPSELSVEEYVVRLLIEKLQISTEELKDLHSVGLVSLGLDSIKSIELLEELKNGLKIDIDIQVLADCESIRDLIECLELQQLLGTPESLTSDEELQL